MNCRQYGMNCRQGGMNDRTKNAEAVYAGASRVGITSQKRTEKEKAVKVRLKASKKAKDNKRGRQC